MVRTPGGGGDFGAMWSLGAIAPEAKNEGVYEEGGTMAALIINYLRCTVFKKLAAPARCGIAGAVFSTPFNNMRSQVISYDLISYHMILDRMRDHIRSDSDPIQYDTMRIRSDIM